MEKSVAEVQKMRSAFIKKGFDSGDYPLDDEDHRFDRRNHGFDSSKHGLWNFDGRESFSHCQKQWSEPLRP